MNNAFEVCKGDGEVTPLDLAKYLSMSERTVYRRIKEVCPNLTVEDGLVKSKEEVKKE
jgi:transcriptional antiterminator